MNLKYLAGTALVTTLACTGDIDLPYVRSPQPPAQAQVEPFNLPEMPTPDTYRYDENKTVKFVADATTHADDLTMPYKTKSGVLSAEEPGEDEQFHIKLTDGNLLFEAIKYPTFLWLERKKYYSNAEKNQPGFVYWGYDGYKAGFSDRDGDIICHESGAFITSEEAITDEQNDTPVFQRGAECERIFNRNITRLIGALGEYARSRK